MEVEFLSNMRYNLFVTVEEWERWLQQLTSLVAYRRLAEEAFRLSASVSGLTSRKSFSLQLSSPTNMVPSPSQFRQSSVASSVKGYPPSNMPLNPAMPTTMTTSSGRPSGHYPRADSSPLSAHLKPSPTIRSARKRALEADENNDDVPEYPAKRGSSRPVAPS